MEITGRHLMKESAGKILMLVENKFPQDPRVWNEAKKLNDQGCKVTVISLKSKNQTFRENIEGINVYRLAKVAIFKKGLKYESDDPLRRFKKILMDLGYILEYIYFTLGCLIMSPYIFFKHGFEVIHAHNPPDTLFLVAMFYKLLGKKFVLDIHDLSPELYRSRFGVEKGLILRILGLTEKVCLFFTDIVIVTNESYKEIILNRSRIKENQIFVVRNGPNLERIRSVKPENKYKITGKTILSYVGSMNPQDGVDYLLRSLCNLLNIEKRADFYCYIMGSGDSVDDLIKYSIELGLENHVRFTGYIPDDDLRMIMSAADICVDPDPSSPLNDVSTWIKIMEYMAFGKPIVTFDLKETRYSALEAAIYVKPNDEIEFAKAIVTLMEDPARCSKMGDYGRKRILQVLSWDKVSPILLEAYSSLFTDCRKNKPTNKAA